MWSTIAAAALGAGRVEDSGRRPSTAAPRGLIGNANGGKYGAHCSSVPKQRSGVLRVMPRGSKPTRSNRARTSWVNRDGPGEDREVDARAARPARVEEQRADPMSRIGGRQPDDRERDRRAVRAGRSRAVPGPSRTGTAPASRSTCSNRSLPSRRPPCRPRRLRRRKRAPRTQQLRRVSSSCLPLSGPRACRRCPTAIEQRRRSSSAPRKSTARTTGLQLDSEFGFGESLPLACLGHRPAHAR